MLREVHEHILGELNQSSRTDTIFVVTAILFNLVVLGINSAVAGEAGDNGNSASDWILVVFMIMTVLVNLIAIIALQTGRKTRTRLLGGLVKMYEDNDVSRYYDAGLLGDYSVRYTLFTGVILLLAVTAVTVPLIVRWA